jgi:Domain of unknown function (DUF4292)
VHLNRFGRDFGVVIAFVSILSSSCLVRTRTVAPRGQQANRPALTATKQELLERIRRVADPIQSFSIKAEMSPSVGGVFGGRVTDYPTIRGFILFRRADQIRVIGLDPVVHSTILDMVSLGNDFHVSIPTKSQFIEGSNDAPATSKNKLENLRPIAFLNSLLINPAGPSESTIMVDDSDETMAMYNLMFVKSDGDELRLLRAVYFDRYTLDISRQRTFDTSGQVASETKYADWTAHGAVRFPSSIDMARPKDGYELRLKITDFLLNPPEITDEKFVLNPPANAQVQTLSR